MPHDEHASGLDTLARELRAAAGQLRQYGRLAASRMFGTLSTRAEMNAVARVLIDKGVVTQAELTAVGKTWPELRVEEHAIHATDLPAHAARAKREGWPK